MGESGLSMEAYLAASPLHRAVYQKDHLTLRQILATLPKPPPAGAVKTEEESVKAEQRAEDASAILDNRDVPGRETPLHLAVKVKDAVAVELLMLAGADVSLQNQGGWTALQEAVCAGEPTLATIIMREYQTQAWAKWLRRLPRLAGTMTRMRDFYMELTWHFESSVIPFIGRIAPSDTYRIWKKGSHLRADMTLSGFDGFRIQRAQQSIIFLGNGSADAKHPPGSVLLLSHKDKEAMDALEGIGGPPSEADLAADVAAMFQTNVYRAGIDVTEAELVPQKTWRRNERVESVGNWEAKVYDMNHVHVTFKSRKVPGAMSDEELFMGSEDEGTALNSDEQLQSVLTPEEQQQLKEALEEMDSQADAEEDPSNSARPEQAESSESGKKSWFSRWTRKSADNKPAESTNDEESRPASSSPYVTPGSSVPGSPSRGSPRRSSVEERSKDGGKMEGKAKKGTKPKHRHKEKDKHLPGSEVREYKRGLKPSLWLTEDFPLTTAELLPLLDLLSPRVKAVRRLRELLTTKLPTGTFPAKVAIPVIPTIRVVVTFTKFKERTSKPVVVPEESVAATSDADEAKPQSSSWFSWVTGRREGDSEEGSSSDEDKGDVFAVPEEFKWVDLNERKRRSREKRRKQKGKKEGSKAPAQDAEAG